MRKNIFNLTLSLFCLFQTQFIFCQETYKISNPSNADIKVLGTSNLHNWTMETRTMTCSAKFIFRPGNPDQLQSLTNLVLAIPIRNLKSGESLMDSRAYSALKADKFNNIGFVLTSAAIVPLQKGQFQIKSTGDLSIAGVTKSITLLVECMVNADGTINCSGAVKLKMTDYQIKPPVFMMGALKTGDELTVDFKLVLNK
jgi:polyisoprenoid-binding protein YceI